jgi:hypothetical protein
MNEALLAMLCAELQAGRLHWTEHYSQRLLERPTPTRSEIRYLLCDDEPEVIEPYGRSCLIWGIMVDGRVGHVVCSHPPSAVVVTAYWPDDTEPWEWAENYRRRIRQ